LPGQRAGASLGTAAARPDLAGMYDRSTVRAHALERSRQIVHREVGQRERVARAAPASTDANGGRRGVRLPALALPGPARLQLETQHARPETPSALGVIGGELDQGGTSRQHLAPKPYACG